MDFETFFPVWKKLTKPQQELLRSTISERSVKKGTTIHNGQMDCTGLLLVRSGQLRAYITSEDGREISVYRLFERDIGLMSASCILNSIQFDISIEVNNPMYYFSGLESVKLDLLSAAAADAHERAKNIVENSGAELGNLTWSRAGVFQITAATGDEEFSAGGSFNLSSREKKARVTVRSEFKIKNKNN